MKAPRCGTCCVVAAIVVNSLGAAVWAGQPTAASVSGTIYDQQQTVLPGATIALKNLETGQVRVTTSDQTGNFRVVGLVPGRYEMMVERPGFAPGPRSEIDLTISEDAEIDATLELAPLAETLNVAAEGPLTQISGITLARTITTREIEQLPVAARDFANLAILTPGILTNHSTPRGATGIVAAGQTGRHNTFLVDGLSLDETMLGNSRGGVSLEAVREFIVLSNTFTAEYGQASGAVVSVLTRSGTNQFAGRGFYFHRDDRWDATHAATRLTAPPGEKSKLEQKTLGGFVGGPLARDRAFFFGSVEHTMVDTEHIVTSRVLSAFRPQDPAHLPVRGRNPQAIGRADGALARSNLLTLRYRIDRGTLTNNTVDAGPVGLIARERRQDLSRADQDFAVLDSHVFGARAFNDFRSQIARRQVELDVRGYCPGCPQENRPSILLGKSTIAPQRVTEDRWQFADALTYLVADRIGDHEIKTGADLSVIRVDSFAPLFFDGSFIFTHDRPFDAADATTYPSRFTGQSGDPFIHLTNAQYALYIQDHWRLRPNLSLMLGTRWDYESGPLISSDRDNVAPRLGVAFSPRKSGRTTIRAGYGVYYDQVLFTAPVDGIRATRFTTTLIVDPGYPNPLGPNPRRNSPAVPVRIATLTSDLMTPHTKQASAGVRHVRGRFAVTADAVWARGYSLFRTRDVNYPDLDDPQRRRPNPAFQEIRTRESEGRSWYRGLQVGVQKRHANRYSYAVAYTLSRSERDTEDFDFRAQDQRDYAAERGPSSSDVRHRFSASANVDLPLGLRVTSLVTARGALPYNITTGLDDNRDTFFTDRPPGMKRNSARGDEFWQIDARVAREFRVGPQRVEVLGEAFNLTNRRNWTAYDGNQRSVTFGRPTSAANPREVQLGLRVSF